MPAPQDAAFRELAVDTGVPTDYLHLLQVREK
jgi:hypothetical protein